MNTDTYAIGVRAIVEAKRPASFLKKLILVCLYLRLAPYYICAKALVRLHGCACAPEPSLHMQYVPLSHVLAQIMHMFHDNARLL